MHYTHNTKEIKDLLIAEEGILIGKINKFKLKYNQQIKKKSNEEVMNKLLLNCDKIKESEGINKEIIENICNITISK